MMLELGQKLPVFHCLSDEGAPVSQADLRGAWSVIYVYPKDHTPGCTMEGKDFSSLHQAFVDAGARIYGVSKDSPERHASFKSKHAFPFVLLSDEELSLVKGLGAWVEKSMFGKKYMGLQRSTFLFDSDGGLQAVWPKVKVKGHAQAVLDALKMQRS